MSTHQRKAYARDVAWLVGTVCVGVAVLYATLFIDLRLGLALVLALFGVISLTLSTTVRHSLGYAAGALLIIAASSTAISSLEGASVISVALRIVGFGVIVLLASRPRPERPIDAVGSHSRKWAYVVGASLGSYFLVGAAFHGQILTFLFYTAGLGILLITVVRTEGAADPDLRRGLVLALSLLVSTSLLYGLAVPSAGFENGRLRGFMENANTLGFFAYLLGAAALILVRQIRWRAALLAIAVVALVLTASRASALALVLVIAILVLRRGVITTIVVLFGSGAAVALAFTVNPALFNPLSSLLRFNDSRSDSTATAIGAFLTNPLIGVGVGNESSIIASSPFRALAQAGLVGVAAVVAMWLVLLIEGARRGVAAVALGLSAIVHSVFEGWLLSPVSPLLGVFLLLWIAVRTDARPKPIGARATSRYGDESRITSTRQGAPR
ncbi:O-antigen ligase [Frigoribacterium sp. VKM Ac-2530]|uniref:O-antigen ligase family protein n=1 Tax=Frigoribacterium sp. VKM Ac-2530 TaxID=2783822 RepID=UPI00188A0802|nr:hypothetical protein [Frigoribacterium sp. VKM Ac-2530]MBF4578674.1 hypothetical protein [Frigoribacterium sp. VKM Ac-2530]